jgi:hypothetical protein
LKLCLSWSKETSNTGVKSGRTQKACPLVYHSINLVDWMLPNPPIATNKYGNNHIVERVEIKVDAFTPHFICIKEQ